MQVPGPGSPAMTVRWRTGGGRGPAAIAEERLRASRSRQQRPRLAFLGVLWEPGADWPVAEGAGVATRGRGGCGWRWSCLTLVKTSPLSAAPAPGCRDRLDSLAAQLFTALVSLAQAQRRMHSDSRGGSGEVGLPARGCRSQRCGVMPDPGVVVPEDAALGRGAAAAQGTSRALPFGKARCKPALMPAPPSSSALVLERG